jgi:hypothetical protein
MSSDCFYVRVKSVRDNEVIFDVLTGTAGGYDDLCASRSFALCLLNDALGRSVDNLPGAWDDPVRQQEAKRRREADQNAPLNRALKEQGDWYISESWMRNNIARFITSCTLVERRNNVGDQELQRRGTLIEEEFGGALYTNQNHLWQPRRWELCHNYTLRVTLADPQWGVHLIPGIEFGTTAFDVWYERPSQ